MLVNTTNGVFGTPTAISATVTTPAQSYADIKNARFNNAGSQIVSIQQRWNDTFNALPLRQQHVIQNVLSASIAEFRRRNPNLKTWQDVEKRLAKAHHIKMPQGMIDATMQRLLNIEWVLELLNKFTPTRVVPIQVYQPDITKSEYLAWDGQHTLVLLWLIATQVFGENPDNVMIPVNIYDSHYKAEMRGGFVSLNSNDGSRQLDLFDLFEQMVYGVRIDKSTNPEWILAEQKQSIIEKHGLFLTSKKFGDTDEDGAISRMQEVNKLTAQSLDWLCEYLVAVGANSRPVEEKEMVMMAYFFDKCRHAKVNVTPQFIYEIASVTKRHWNADFSPMSTFWVRAGMAYAAWHATAVGQGSPHFYKEPNHGYPFFVEQLKKDLPHHQFPDPRSSSDFFPDAQDLF